MLLEMPNLIVCNSRHSWPSMTSQAHNCLLLRETHSGVTSPVLLQISDLWNRVMETGRKKMASG